MEENEPMMHFPDEITEDTIILSRSEEMEKILIEHEVMWGEMQGVHRDFWTARDKYYNYLVSNNIIKVEDFHVYKMVLGRRCGK